MTLAQDRKLRNTNLKIGQFITKATSRQFNTPLTKDSIFFLLQIYIYKQRFTYHIQACLSNEHLHISEFITLMA